MELQTLRAAHTSNVFVYRLAFPRWNSKNTLEYFFHIVRLLRFMSAFMTVMECRTSNGMQIFVKCFVPCYKKKFGFFLSIEAREREKESAETEKSELYLCDVKYSNCSFFRHSNKQLSCLFICILLMLMIVDSSGKRTTEDGMNMNSKIRDGKKSFRVRKMPKNLSDIIEPDDN